MWWARKRRFCVFRGLAVAIGVAFMATARAQAPDKATIIFISDREGGAFWLMDPDGQDQRPIEAEQGGSAMAWSPDGRRIAFSGGGDIFVVDADGQNLEQLTEDPAADRWPTWHPSGQQLAFASKRDGNLDIYVMDANGENLRNVTNHPDADFDPSWSPTGQKIAFYSSRDGNSEIYAMLPSGEKLTRLTDDPGDDIQPDWSSDGRRIVFVSNRHDENDEIYVMDADGRNLERLTDVPERDSQPVWSPDGTRIAFASVRQGKLEIWVMDADGGNPEKLTSAGNWSQWPDWFDPTVVPFAVSSRGRLPVAWGWIRAVGPRP